MLAPLFVGAEMPGASVVSSTAGAVEIPAACVAMQRMTVVTMAVGLDFGDCCPFQNCPKDTCRVPLLLFSSLEHGIMVNLRPKNRPILPRLRSEERGLRIWSAGR